MPTLNGKSLDILEENIKNLRQLFPEVECDGKIDFDMLRQILGEYVDDDKERYNFKWNGKGRALRFSQTPSTGTLRPCKEESKNWDDTQNLYIEGDNLEVLKILQKSYHGKIKMIYIDPPYNTGKDFVYPDNYHDSIENYKAITGQTDEEGNRISTNTEASGRFHTDWLNMMYPRLRLARNLLTDDGVIFISIDDSEQENLKKICDEIFGEDNIIAVFPRVTKKAGKSSEIVAKNNDYVLIYSKSSNVGLYPPEHTDDGFKYSDEYENIRGKYKLNQTLDYDSLQYSPSLDYPIEIDGETIYPGQSYEKYIERQNGKHGRADWAWRWSKELFEFGLKEGFIVVKHYDTYSRIYTKTYQNANIRKSGNEFIVEIAPRTRSISSLEFIDNVYSNDNSKKNILEIFKTSVFDYSKPTQLLKSISKYSTKKDDIILDFFSGSATTAHAVMQLNAEDGGNRRFICVQLPEPTQEDSEAFKAGYKNICEIGKERIRRAGEKIKAEVESGNEQLKIDEQPKIVPDIGFKVFKLDSSNLKKWNPNFDNLELILDNMIDNYVPDRTEEDVVYEFMLKMGLDLSYPIDITEIDGKKVYSIEFGALMMCLDDNITVSVAEGMVRMYKEQVPETWKVVFKDNGFADDCIKTNVKLTLIQAGLEEDAFTTV